MQLTDYQPALLWMDQFSRRPEDRELAAQMLAAFRYVSNVDLASDIEVLLEQIIPRNENAALYVEREFKTTRSGKPIKMYREEKAPRVGHRKKALRATGAAQPAVLSPTNNRQQVGSEGVIAQQLTQLCARHQRRFLLHPSAEEIRRVRVRNMVIITDFVGSGKRVRRMLDSLWQVRSIRSWQSGKFVRIWVVCYSGTATGLVNTQNHPSKPRVRHVMPCPTLDTAFDTERSERLKELCIRYGQFHDRPLGYGDVGALIAFEHSCPNNVPAVFIETSDSHRSPWQPMFEKRSTVQLARAASIVSMKEETLVLETLKYPNIAVSSLYLRSSQKKRNTILLLAALSRGHRHVSELVGIVRMPLWQLSEVLIDATELGLLDTHRRLTSVGRKELRKMALSRPKPVTQPPQNYYYPSVLRAPCS